MAGRRRARARNGLGANGRPIQTTQAAQTKATHNTTQGQSATPKAAQGPSTSAPAAPLAPPTVTSPPPPRFVDVYITPTDQNQPPVQVFWTTYARLSQLSKQFVHDIPDLVPINNNTVAWFISEADAEIDALQFILRWLNVVALPRSGNHTVRIVGRASIQEQADRYRTLQSLDLVDELYYGHYRNRLWQHLDKPNVDAEDMVAIWRSVYDKDSLHGKVLGKAVSAAIEDEDLHDQYLSVFQDEQELHDAYDKKYNAQRKYLDRKAEKAQSKLRAEASRQLAKQGSGLSMMSREHAETLGLA